MKIVVVDTDIWVDFFRGKKELLEELWKRQLEGKVRVVMSVVTVMELLTGKTGKKDEKILLGMMEELKVIPVDYRLARFAGESKRGKKINIALADYLIGMTAVFVKGYLVTRNKKHFEGIAGLKFLEA